MLKRLAARSGLERRVHPHALRHTMAAELLREGASVRHIQLQLGHSDLSTTAAYLESIQPLELVEMARSRPRWNGASDVVAFGLSDDVVVKVLVEEVLGTGPTAETITVPMEFRLKIRAEVQAAKEAGLMIEIPNT